MTPLSKSPMLGPTALAPQDLLPPSFSGLQGSKDPKAAAQAFEGMLMAQLFQVMRKTVEPSGLFSENEGARTTYEYLLDQAVVEQAMKQGKGWGLAERLERSWTQKQE